MTDTDKLIQTPTHTRGEIKRKPGRPVGSKAKNETKRAMKRQFARVVKPGVFRDIVQKVADQALKGDINSQKLIFEYGMLKPSQEVESQARDFGITINIGSMEDKTIEVKEDIEDGVWEEEEKR